MVNVELSTVHIPFKKKTNRLNPVATQKCCSNIVPLMFYNHMKIIYNIIIIQVTVDLQS